MLSEYDLFACIGLTHADLYKYMHKRGIVHNDIKPAIRPGGYKVNHESKATGSRRGLRLTYCFILGFLDD